MFIEKNNYTLRPEHKESHVDSREVHKVPTVQDNYRELEKAKWLKVKTAISFIIEQLQSGFVEEEKISEAREMIDRLVDFIDLALKTDLDYPLTIESMAARNLANNIIQRWSFGQRNIRVLEILAYLRRVSRMLQFSTTQDQVYRENVERLQEFVDLLITTEPL